MTDRRELPTYTISETTHYLSVPAATIRYWSVGRGSYLPQQNRVAALPESVSMPFADRTRVKGTGELIDLFGAWLRRSVREQLVEMDRHPITVPFRGGRKSNGDSVGDGAVHKRLTIGWWKFPFLASQEAIPDFLTHILSIPSYFYKTANILLYSLCSFSSAANSSSNGRNRCVGQLGICSYSMSPCRNSEWVRCFTVLTFNHRS